MTGTTTLDLLRHGACDDGDIFRGTTDSPLSNLGSAQMAAALTPHHGWQRVISSPMRRCRKFAEAFAAQHGLPFALEPGLRELHFGVWEGRAISEVWRTQGELLEHYYRYPGTVRPPGGESADEARIRLHGAWRRLLGAHRGEHLLLVLHGGAIRLLLCQLLGAPLTNSQGFHIPHGCLTRIRVHQLPDGDMPQLIFHTPGNGDD